LNSVGVNRGLGLFFSKLEIITPPLGPLRGSGVGVNRGLGFYFLAAICFTL